ncbi:MAG TPA: nitroreductase/quinone reductase family protein [Candidatus Dormibacteraeota bacterium]|jgi:hypothetical protein|nr:nitroreductase/quinone reductase family protein [Candidatus Dormibacteraeota bacterium]
MSAQPSIGPRIPRFVRYANPVITTLGRMGLVLGTMRLLTVPGRKSGKMRTTPVSPFKVDGRLYICSMGHVEWVRNARASGWGILARGRRHARFGLVEIPLRERGAILREFPARVPHGASMFVRLGIVASVDPDAFAAAADRMVVFRADPMSEEPGTAG